MRPNGRAVRRGTIHWVDWSPARGSEQAGRRLAVVLQENPASENPRYPLTIVVAVSSKGRQIPTHVSIEPTERNGLSTLSYVKCEQIQTVSKDRLVGYIGEMDVGDMDRVGDALKRVLALS